MLTFIIVLLVAGLICGAIARLLMPGRDSIGLVGTIVLGIVGSFVGGFPQNPIRNHSASIHSFHMVGRDVANGKNGQDRKSSLSFQPFPRCR